MDDFQSGIRRWLVAIPAFGIAAGFAAQAWIDATWANWIWAVATVPVLLALAVEIVTRLRQKEVGLDIVAALSMTAALAFAEELAAVIVALMYAGGQYLENYAERRARKEMTALLTRVPRTATRYRDGNLEEVALDEIAPADRLLIRAGDVVPVDGRVAKGLAVLDQSVVTGESLPVKIPTDGLVVSGVSNVGEPFDLEAMRPAKESTYAGIVRLVEEAQRSKAPMARLADRFAIVFLFVTLALAGGAWLVTGDPIRAVAVLVIATPCPLILAVPVALVAGLSRAAKHGVLIKGGRALEALARIRALILDKTGTLTAGKAQVVGVEPALSTPEELLRIAASLDQASQHVIAKAIVAEARNQQLPLVAPSAMSEVPGEGITGNVEGRQVTVGGESFVAGRLTQPPHEASRHIPGAVSVAVAIDGVFAGRIVLADALREHAASFLQESRRQGIERIVLATGDRRAVAEAVADDLPIDEIRSELKPEEKISLVLAEREHRPVGMVGDGVNDAPALAAADVGVAMGASGAAASAEAADIVLLVDDISRLLPGILIARRSLKIAFQSVYVGLGLSFVGMVAAAFGYLPPVTGALLQEAIDVAVILNALRALR